MRSVLTCSLVPALCVMRVCRHDFLPRRCMPCSCMYARARVCRHDYYDSKADVWSWGVLLVECMTNQRPYQSTFMTPIQVCGRPAAVQPPMRASRQPRSQPLNTGRCRHMPNDVVDIPSSSVCVCLCVCVCIRRSLKVWGMMV